MTNEWFKFTEEKVTVVSEFVELLLDELRAPYLFRGHADSEWELEPEIDRPLIANPNIQRKDQEKLALEEFERLSVQYLKSQPWDNWELLALARHSGMPTRLLDWTENPLAALFFAVEEITDKDSAVWCYTYIEMERPIDFIEHPDPLNIERVLLYRPPHIHPRMASQESVFTTHPPEYKTIDNPWGELPLVRVIIPNHARGKIRIQLQRLGVHRASLFRDLDGVGKYIHDKWRVD